MNKKYLQIFYVAIMICFLMKYCETDIVLEGIISENKNLYKAANKATFSYVRKFLFKQIKNSTFTNHLNNIYFTLVNVADHFCEISKIKIKKIIIIFLSEIPIENL